MVALAVAGGAVSAPQAYAAKQPKQEKKATAKQENASSVFATVGGEDITWMDYDNEYRKEVNSKFYHAKPQESELGSFQRQVGSKLVDDTLLTQEAKRRKLKPDQDFVKQQLDLFEARFKSDPKWPEARTRVLPILTKRFENENLRNKLEEQVRDVPAPDEKQLRDYYAAHPDKFTTPPQPKVSVILLRMDPSSSDTEWQKANEAAQDLEKRLRAGENFAELAKQYSGDASAESGGDMGYLHGGMLPGLPEQIVNSLKPGEISDPVRLLEGIAIFRLDDRIPSKVNSFDEAKTRVSQLLTQELSDQAWSSLLAKLRKITPIKMDESRFAKLAEPQNNPDEKAQSDAGTEKK